MTATIPLNAPSIAQIGTFFNNRDGAILHNISADIRSQGRLEMEMRATHMRKLQNLEWGFILNNPKLRYVYNDLEAGKLVGKSYKEREKFLNSIGVTTIELKSTEISALERAQETVGCEIKPMPIEDDIRIYRKLNYDKRTSCQLIDAVDQFDFKDFLEAWTIDPDRIIVTENQNLLDTYLRNSVKIVYDDDRETKTKIFIMASLIIRDYYLVGNFNNNIPFLDVFGTRMFNVTIATLAACGLDFLKNSQLKYFISRISTDYIHFSIIAPHLGDISSINSKLQRDGPFHLIPYLIQGHNMCNFEFIEFITESESLDVYWAAFQRLGFFITDLMKIYNFTDADLRSEMLKYIDDPNVERTSSMRDYRWKYAYYCSKGYIGMSLEDAFDIKYPHYQENDHIFTGYDHITHDDNNNEILLPKHYLQIGERYNPSNNN